MTTTEPWTAEPIGDGKFKFTNVSGGRLAMITLTPVQATRVEVEGFVAGDPHSVPSPVDAGESFIATVRGPGVQVNATAVPAMRYVYWSLSI